MAKPRMKKYAPGRIELTARAVREVKADYADVSVKIASRNRLVGNAPLEQAAEVRAFVESLVANRIGREQVELLSLSMDVDAKLLGGRKSGVEYRLRVRCQPTDKIGVVVGAAADLEHVNVGRIDWHYPDELETRREMLAEATAELRERLDHVVERFGQRVLQVEEFDEFNLGAEKADGPTFSHSDDLTRSVKARSSRAPVDLGTPLTRTEERKLTISVTFLVTGASTPEHDAEAAG